VSEPEQAGQSAGRHRPASMAFRKRRNAPLPTPGETRRQNDVIRSAWTALREPGPVIAFLNTRHEALGDHPLHLAIESDEGLKRVERLLEQMTLKG